MKELSEVVTSTINTMVTDGTVEQLIATKLKSTIATCIDDAMKSYGTFGKAISAKIEESIQRSANDIQIPAYNQFIKTVVTNKFIQLLDKNAAEHLGEIIEEALPPISKQSKFSTVMDQIQEVLGDLGRENGKDMISIDVEGNSDNTALYVTIEKPDYGDKLKVTFYNFRGEGWHIGYINQYGHRITGNPVNVAGICLDELSTIFYQYYAMGTNFEADVTFDSIDLY